MMTEPNPDQPHLYEIRLKGHLDPQRALFFENLAIELTSEGITVLIGHIPDQAALHSMLARVRDLGIPLLSVRCLGEKQKGPVGFV